jgi:hypothetical protein
MAIQKILLPYNFTKNDRRALDFVIQTFATQENVEVTLFNAYTGVPEIETRQTSVMGKLKGNLNYLSQKIMEQEAELKEALMNLVRNGFMEDRLRYVFRARKKDIAGEIIELAKKEQFNTIVLNHKPGQVSRFFSASVFNKVVTALDGITVCIVS